MPLCCPATFHLLSICLAAHSQVSTPLLNHSFIQMLADSHCLPQPSATGMWLQALPGMLLPDCSFSIDLGWFQLWAGVKKNHLVFAHPMKKLAQKIAVLLSSSDGVGSLQPAPNVAHSTRFFLNMIRGTNTQRCKADRCGSQSVRRWGGVHNHALWARQQVNHIRTQVAPACLEKQRKRKTESHLL